MIGDYSFDMPLKEGDRLVFEDMALYTMVKTNTFNGMPLPSIALRHVDGSKEVIRSFGYEDFKKKVVLRFFRTAFLKRNLHFFHADHIPAVLGEITGKLSIFQTYGISLGGSTVSGCASVLTALRSSLVRTRCSVMV